MPAADFRIERVPDEQLLIDTQERSSRHPAFAGAGGSADTVSCVLSSSNVVPIDGSNSVDCQIDFEPRKQFAFSGNDGIQ